MKCPRDVVLMSITHIEPQLLPLEYPFMVRFARLEHRIGITSKSELRSTTEFFVAFIGKLRWPNVSAAVLSGQLGAGPAIIGLAAISAAAYAGIVAGSLMMATYHQSVCAMKSRALSTQVTAFLQGLGIYDSGMIQIEILRNPQIQRMVA